MTFEKLLDEYCHAVQYAHDEASCRVRDEARAAVIAEYERVKTPCVVTRSDMPGATITLSAGDTLHINVQPLHDTIANLTAELAAERQRAERYRVALEYLLDHWSEKAAHAMARAALEQSK